MIKASLKSDFHDGNGSWGTRGKYAHFKFSNPEMCF